MLARGHRPSIQAVLDRVAHEVERLPKQVLGEFLPVLREARREAARGLQQWLEEHAEDGAARYTAHKYRAALAQMDAALEKVGELAPELGQALQDGKLESWEMAGDHLIDQLGAFSAQFRDAITPLPIEQAARMVRENGARPLMARESFTSSKRYVGQVAKDIKQQLSIGLVKGETVFQMRERLIRHGGPRGLVALRGVVGEPGAVSEVIAEGLFKRYEYWAERLVRTEIADAYGESAQSNLMEVREVIPEVMKRWHTSGRDGVCLICKPMDGETVKPDAEFSGGIFRPPAHPNCLCVSGPWLPDMK